MFGFIKKLRNKNNEESAEYRFEFAKKISTKKIKYLSERITDDATNEVVDTIIGKEGVFYINKEGELVIYCDGKSDELFRAYIPDLKAYEFMSLEGVVLESVDLNSGKERQIIAYYKYHRK